MRLAHGRVDMPAERSGRMRRSGDTAAALGVASRSAPAARAVVALADARDAGDRAGGDAPRGRRGMASEPVCPPDPAVRGGRSAGLDPWTVRPDTEFRLGRVTRAVLADHGAGGLLLSKARVAAGGDHVGEPDPSAAVPPSALPPGVPAGARGRPVHLSGPGGTPAPPRTRRGRGADLGRPAWCGHVDVPPCRACGDRAGCRLHLAV